MKKERIFVFWAVLTLCGLIAMLTFADAAFTYKSNNIKREYSAGEVISGTVNISFKDEPANSLFESNFAGNMTLLDLLKANNFEEGVSYNCTTKNCLSDYVRGDEITSPIKLKKGEGKVIGFEISDSGIDMQSILFSLSSNAAPNCTSQLSLDILAKDEYVMQNQKYKQNSCGYKYVGCFNGNAPLQDVVIGSRPYCEKIDLPSFPAVEVGSKIKNGSSYNELKISLYDSNKNFLGDCILPRHTQNIEELTCIINYSGSETQSYFACLSASDDSDYSTDSENSGKTCGMFGLDSETYPVDYNIFARTMQFDSVNLNVNSTSFSQIFPDGESLREYVQGYIDEIYEGDCTNKCYIPFEIKSQVPQNVTISNAKMTYTSGERGNVYSSRMYLLDNRSAKINSGYLNLNIEPANFMIPLGSNENKCSIYLNDKQLFQSINISITKSFDMDITPKSVAVALETEFGIESGEEITKSTWKFGDEALQAVNDDKIKYTLYKEGNWTVEVSATDSKGITTRRTFIVFVGNSREAAGILINNYESDLKNISLQIDSFPEWIRQEINKKLNLSESKTNLEKIKSDYNSTAESNYTKIIEELVKLNIPNSVYVGKSWNDMSLDVIAAELDTSYIESISKITAGDKDDLKLNILNWIRANYNTNISSKTIYLRYKRNAEAFFSIFGVDLRAKTTNKTEAYLIMDYPKDEIVFKTNYGAAEISPELTAGTYLPVSDSKNIEFIIFRDVEPASLKMYLSPDAKTFIEEHNATLFNPDNPKQKTAKMWYWIIAILAFILYIILQEWYKRKYESYLFRDKDELYNLLTFIHNSRAAGLEDREIKGKLEDSGWKGEQVSFAFKKIDGKRTGMFEIPIFRFFERRIVRGEIAKRQQPQRDVRFIKRP